MISSDLILIITSVCVSSLSLLKDLVIRIKNSSCILSCSQKIKTKNKTIIKQNK